MARTLELSGGTGSHMEASERIEAVTGLAEAIRVYPDAPPALIFKSGEELATKAATYQEDGQIEKAYMSYTSFLTLFLDKLHHQPQYNGISTAEKSILELYCNAILPQVETLKKQLLKQYASEHEEYHSLVDKLQRQVDEQRQIELAAENGSPGRSGGSSQLISNPPSSPQHSSTYAERASSGTFLPDAFGVVTSQAGSPLPGTYVYEDTLALFRSGGEDQQPIVPPEGGEDQEPSAPTNCKGAEDQLPSFPPEDGEGQEPSAPPEEFELFEESLYTFPDKNTTPKQFWTPPATAIRPVMVPADLVPTFLRYVKFQTGKNVEACGLLTGKISDEELIITTLIIPKQSGTSDTCNMLDELETFYLQDQCDLATFGWIHTHPSQTAFLSSVDLHNHYGYQVSLPEAIAIVCAPKMDQVGTFSLTAAGMKEIGTCRRQGFHPHSSYGLFEEAHHYILDPSRKLEVHDLRTDFNEIE